MSVRRREGSAAVTWDEKEMERNDRYEEEKPEMGGRGPCSVDGGILSASGLCG